MKKLNMLPIESVTFEDVCNKQGDFMKKIKMVDASSLFFEESIITIYHTLQISKNMI